MPKARRNEVRISAFVSKQYSEPPGGPSGEAGGEVVAALDAGSGKTLWEHRYPAPPLPGMALENGPGPHSTPLLAGDRLFTIGVTGRLHSLEKETGRVVWSKRALEDLEGSILGRGYSSSPMAYRDLVIVPVGGPGHGMVAFGQRDRPPLEEPGLAYEPLQVS